MTQHNLVTPDVLKKLTSLKSTLRGRLFGEGFAWVILAIAGAMMVTFFLDYLLNLPAPLRIAFMLIAVSGVGVVLWRKLFSPLLVPMKTESLALLVEKHFGELGDRFISALQFSKFANPATVGMSPDMVNRVVQEANTMTSSLAFGSIVEFKKMLKTLALAGGVVLILGGLGAWQSNLFGIWFERNLLLKSTPWPQDTYLEVGDFVINDDNKPTEKFKKRQDFTVHRGEDLRIIIRVGQGPTGQKSTIIPSQITIHTKYDRIGQTQEKLLPIDNKPGYFEKTFQSVSEEFEFYVTCDGDKLDKNNPHKVLLQETAEMQEITYILESPAYMNLPSPFQILDANTESLLVPAGGIVHFEGKSSMPLSQCQLYINGWRVEGAVGEATPGATSRVKDDPATPADESKIDPTLFHGYFRISKFNLPAYEKAIGDTITIPSGFDGISALADAIRAPATALAATTRGLANRLELSIVFVDTDGFSRIAGTKLIKLKADKSPEFKTFKAMYVTPTVTPAAMIPIQMVITDDYGLEWVQLMVGVNDGAMEPFGERIQTFDEGKTLFNNIGKENEQVIDLTQLATKISAGDRVRIMAIVVDKMPADDGGPNSVTSSEISFQVVSVLDKEKELNIRLQEIDGMFGQCVQLQADALVTSRAIAATISMSDEITEDNQLALKRDIGLQSTTGITAQNIAAKLNDIVNEMEHNQVFNVERRDELRREIVGAIISSFIPASDDVIADLTIAIKSVELEYQAEKLADISPAQEDLLADLNEMRGLLNKNIDLQRAIIKFSEMLEASKRLREMIRILLENESDFD